MDALTLLDEKGTNDTVTRAMTIVCEGFRQHTAKCMFSAKDLFRSANTVLSREVITPRMTVHHQTRKMKSSKNSSNISSVRSKLAADLQMKE
jgi:hypothetical protein